MLISVNVRRKLVSSKSKLRTKKADLLAANSTALTEEIEKLPEKPLLKTANFEENVETQKNEAAVNNRKAKTSLMREKQALYEAKITERKNTSLNRNVKAILSVCGVSKKYI